MLDATQLKQIEGYYNARRTLHSEASFEEHQVAREWLASEHGREAARLAFQKLGRGSEAALRDKVEARVQ